LICTYGFGISNKNGYYDQSNFNCFNFNFMNKNNTMSDEKKIVVGCSLLTQLLFVIDTGIFVSKIYKGGAGVAG
jgi:hypothetical protein